MINLETGHNSIVPPECQMRKGGRGKGTERGEEGRVLVVYALVLTVVELVLVVLVLVTNTGNKGYRHWY